MQKKKIILIIAIIVIFFITFVAMLSSGIISINNKSNIARLNENIQRKISPNIPRISAGMIPLKQVGEYYEITTVNDNAWYDYENGIPAYIMLNDGVYQSEEYYQMPSDKKLSENNIGTQININDTDTLGSIYMWIPRFVENTETGEIEYLEQGKIVAGNLQMQSVFTYETEEMDFSLSGVWVEVKENENVSNIAENMNEEENSYGFIKNTKANAITEEEKTSINMFIEKILNDTQIDNTNYTILKIVDTSKPEPITASISTDGQQITIDIKYTKHGIKSIINQDGDNVVYSQNGTKATSVINIDDIKYINQFTITDNEDNQVYLEIINNHIYAKLYNGNTLVFTAVDKTIPSLGSVTANYGDVWNIVLENSNYTTDAWGPQKSSITTVNFYDKIFPINTAHWFRDEQNLTKFNNMKNIDTSNVTTMRDMFRGCSSLTSLDLSHFDTKNVTKIRAMFSECNALTSVDLSSFNTSNVTNMEYMFEKCYALTSLDLSNFDTSNVINMQCMFTECTNLTSLDVSSFNTSNVTTMHGMFNSLYKIKSLNISNFDTKNVTSMAWMFCICRELENITFGSNFDTSEVTTMESMFQECYKLTNLDLSSFTTNNSINMKYMFKSCSRLTSWTISDSKWKATTAQTEMFYGSQINYSRGLTRVP